MNETKVIVGLSENYSKCKKVLDLNIPDLNMMDILESYLDCILLGVPSDENISLDELLKNPSDLSVFKLHHSQSDSSKYRFWLKDLYEQLHSDNFKASLVYMNPYNSDTARSELFKLPEKKIIRLNLTEVKPFYFA